MNIGIYSAQTPKPFPCKICGTGFIEKHKLAAREATKAHRAAVSQLAA